MLRFGGVAERCNRSRLRKVFILLKHALPTSLIIVAGCGYTFAGVDIMASLRAQVLGGYKRLLRARVVAFKDDHLMLFKSKEQLRQETEKNRAVTDPKQVGEATALFHVWTQVTPTSTF